MVKICFINTLVVWSSGGYIFIGETGRGSGESRGAANSQHQETTGHVVQSPQLKEHTKMIQKEPRYLNRKVLEVISVNIQGTRLNRNDGQELPDVYLPFLNGRGHERGPKTSAHL